MSLHTNVRYRHLEAQLTDNERYEVFGRIKEIITNVLESRDPKTNSPANDIRKLDRLHRELIGECASFLDQKSYGRLCCTNRSIYLGCTSPNRVTALDLRSIRSGHEFNLSSHPLARKVMLPMGYVPDPHDFIQCISAMKELRSLTLGHLEVSDAEVGGPVQINNTNILDIVADNDQFAQIVDKIARLRMVIYIAEADRCQSFNNNARSIWRSVNGFLSCFSNVQFLDLDYIGGECQASRLQFRNLPYPFGDFPFRFRNLLGLRLMDEIGITHHIFRAIATKLQYLSVVNPPDSVSEIFKNVDFSELTELEYLCTYYKAMFHIVKRAPNLQKLRYKPYFSDFDEYGDIEKHAQFFEAVLSKCLCLTYLDIMLPQIEGNDEIGYDTPALVPILLAMERGLIKTVDVKRHYLKIRICGDVGTVTGAAKAIAVVDRLAKLLGDVAPDFMISVKVRDVPIGLGDVLEVIDRFQVVKGEDKWFSVTNKNGKICKFEERWMIDTTVFE